MVGAVICTTRPPRIAGTALHARGQAAVCGREIFSFRLRQDEGPGRDDHAAIILRGQVFQPACQTPQIHAGKFDRRGRGHIQALPPSKLISRVEINGGRSKLVISPEVDRGQSCR